MRQLKISERTTNRTENTNRLFNEMRFMKPLTREEEEELTYKFIQTRDPKIRDILFKANLRFIVSVAKQYQGDKVKLDDLINEGAIGLLKSIDNFDPSRGFKLISYAVWWIRQGMLEFISSNNNNIRIPLNIITGRRNLEEFTRKFYSKNAVEPTFLEILDGLETDSKTLKNIIDSYKSKTTSYDNVVSEDNNETIVNLLKSSDDHFKEIENNDTKEILNMYLSHIHRNRDLFILKSYYGIDCTPLSLLEIAKELNLSRERVRQIQMKLIKKLQYIYRQKIINNKLD